jgi:hypothetical protein
MTPSVGVWWVLAADSVAVEWGGDVAVAARCNAAGALFGDVGLELFISSL